MEPWRRPGNLAHPEQRVSGRSVLPASDKPRFETRHTSHTDARNDGANPGTTRIRGKRLRAFAPAVDNKNKGRGLCERDLRLQALALRRRGEAETDVARNSGRSPAPAKTLSRARVDAAFHVFRFPDRASPLARVGATSMARRSQGRARPPSRARVDAAFPARRAPARERLITRASVDAAFSDPPLSGLSKLALERPSGRYLSAAPLPGPSHAALQSPPDNVHLTHRSPERPGA